MGRYLEILQENIYYPWKGTKIYSMNTDYIYRGSYRSAHVLLILLNELGKRDKMRGLSRILSIFLNEFNKFNYTGA